MIRWCRIGWTQRLVVLVGIVSLGPPVLAGSSDRSAAAETTAATATAKSGQEIATLEAFRGGVTVIRLGLSQTPSPSMPLQRNDIVVTKQGRATVRFHSEGSVLRIGPDSRVEINESPTERDITVFFGRIWAHVVRWQERMSRFRSDSTTAAIRGTEVSLAVAVDGDETQLSVLEGQVEAETDAGSLMLTGGQSAVSRKGVAPTLRVRVRPQAAVQWALYYVPVIYIEPTELGEGFWQDRVRESSEAYLEGDLQRAIDMLEGIEVQTVRDPRFFTYRASLLLATGSVVEAGEDIRRALKLAAKDSGALALQTIIAVANNDAENALASGQRAVEADPRSATARIALSYAHQALFDLEGARESIETAVKLEPNDALAWARLAEIRSSQGYLDEALEAAQKAVELEANLSRTQTVLGFAYLTRVQTREAQEACRKAIELDQDDPLPRLCLGLALIRKGELSEGSRQIEVAVSLDPGHAVVRSYLGKAYFEAKRTGLDQREYDVAKELDPNDPTPWLYDAIAKQTTNRPVEALQDLQASIERNDNRAIYRSRLALDEDRAARGTSLGRIYDNLGFHQLGVNEASKSLTFDPANASAHRFLSDTYRGVRRRETSRVSELLQAQLLQDVNINPVQPSLSETNLNIVTSGGPAEPGFNEFTPLFERNQVQLNATGLAGDENTFGGEGVISAVYDWFSVSAGAFHYDTNGWRPNHDITHDIYNVFAQAAITSELNVQFELRRRNTEEGDLALNFDPDVFEPNLQRILDQDIARVGLRYSPTPNSDVLLSYIFSDREEEVTNSVADRLLSDAEGHQGEVQYLHRWDRFNLTAGLAYGGVDNELQGFLRIDSIAVFEFSEKTPIDHYRGYLYGNINLPDPVTWTLGVSYDNYNEGPIDVETVNPKVGVQWQVTNDLRLRGALFRTVKPELVANRTIEPTQVAGFSQLFDDANATESWRWGVGADWRLRKDLFAGAEATWRDLDEPIFLKDGVLDAVFDESDEQLHRTYLYWTPIPDLSLGAEFVYDLFEADQGFLTDSGAVPSELQTTSVPLSVRYFHPSGFFVGLGVTYVDQDVQSPVATVRASGHEDFVVVDNVVGYRLPKRFGAISLQVTNLFDDEFRYQDDSFREFRDEPSIGPYIPDRQIMGRITLNF